MRRALEKAWAKIPTAERTQCMGTVNVGGSPSYVELQICLEMMQDSRKHREDEGQRRENPAAKHETRLSEWGAKRTTQLE